MIKKILNRITISLALAGIFAAPLLPATVYAQTPKDEVCKGVVLTGGNCDPANASSSVETVIKTVINLLSLIVGIVAVIMIIIGGLKYITSSGDSNNVTSAKNTILYAVIGLVIVVLAQVIVRFVLDKVG
jgi:cytochrome bd-type quinol oxidase subunit 2